MPPLLGISLRLHKTNGNMTGRTVGGTGYMLTYDTENRLTGVSGGASAAFTYDGDGNRVKGIVRGTTTYYVGNYYEYVGGTVKKYYYHAGKRAPRRRGAMYNGGTLYWLLSDHLGGTTITANSDGTYAGESRYRPYGKQRANFPTGTDPTTFHF